MARIKKEVSETPSRSVEVPLVEVKKKRGRPVATRHHQIVTAYAEEIPVDELGQIDREDGEIIDDPSVESTIERSPASEIESFLEQAAQSRESYEMFVYRHPNYDIDADKGPRAKGRIFVIRMPFNYQTYEADIARYCAKPGLINIFVPEIRHQGLFRTRLDVVRCEPPMIDFPAANQNGGQTASYPTQTQYLPYPVQQQQSASVPIDPFKEVDRTLGLITKMRQAFIGDESKPAEQPQTQLSPEAQVLNVVAKSPGFIESVIDKFIDKGEREPSFTELMFKHGPELANALGTMLQTVIRTAAEEFKQVRQANGEYQEYVQMQNQESNTANQSTSNRVESTDTNVRTDVVVRSQQGATGESPITHQQDLQNGTISQGQSPEDALLTLVCDNCARQIPPKITAQRIWEFADMIAEQAPHLSVDGWIDMFIQYDTETIINLASQGIFGEQGRTLAGMSHSHRWVGDLRDILKETEQQEEASEQ